jgi:dienelactone hydrolase
MSRVILVLLGAALSANPQDQKAPSGDEMFYKYLCAEADKLGEKFLDGAITLKEWEQKQPRLYQEYMDMLGLWPLPNKTPLHATITGKLEHENVIIDKLHFQSKPGLYVTANLYRPKDPPAKKMPAVLYVCGHSNRGRDGNKTAYQDHGMWFASNGYICLMLDTLDLGEIKGQHHGTYGIRETKPIKVRWWWHSAGYTPAGVECWNGVRAIDYLITRDDVDKDRIGVTGISGGGAATFWITAADRRVKVAVPVSGMSDLKSYINNKVINGHCDCMFLYNTYRWDWTTIAALVAPRPMLFANSDNDNIFPMDGNRRVMEKLQKLYTMYDKPDLVDEYVSKGGHGYRLDLRIAVYKFLNKHLKNDSTTSVKDADFKPIPGKELRVFPEDSDIPKEALNAQIDEGFVPRAKVPLPEKGKFEEWKAALIEKLRHQSFSQFPQSIPAASIRVKENKEERTTERHISTVSIILGRGNENSANLMVMAEDHTGTPFIPNNSVATLLLTRGIVAPWDDASPPNYVKRAHALLGTTLDQGRVWDVCAEARLFAETAKGAKHQDFRVVGRGRSGIIAAYAALFEPSIKEIVIENPPVSHMEGPYFLGVLRVLDIPEALGMLAPRPLTLINANDPAFDRTAAIYRLAGAASKLTRR